MAKDSQIDPKAVRAAKASGGAGPSGQPSFADDAADGEGRNAKKQSGNRNDV